MLEPYAGKLARPVLRGGGEGDLTSLPDPPALSSSRGEIPAPRRLLPNIHRRLQRSVRLSATWHAANLTIRVVAPTEGVVKTMLTTNVKVAAALLVVGALAISGLTL